MGSRPRPRDAVQRHRAIAAVFLLVLFGAIGACTDILGIKDKQLTSSGTGGTGASTGGGGSTTSTTHSATAGGGTGGTGGFDPSCRTDADCEGSPYGEHCDPETSKCVECLPGPEDDCAFGLYCDVTKTCAIGCANDADCNPQGQSQLKCNMETHQCFQCNDNVPCPPGSKCNEEDVCIPGCDTLADCPTADWDCCNDQCKNVTKDIENCGACDDPCLPDQSTTWICLDGGCVFQSCALGYSNCDENIAEGNGCEVNTQSDPENCGECDNDCMLAHAGAACMNGSCAIGSCVGEYENCNGTVSDGCEADLAGDPMNCGGCGNDCGDLFPNGVTSCVGMVCQLAGCKPGFGDCDGMEDNGCEVDTNTSIQHCGACDDACMIANGTPQCDGGQCKVLSCNLGFKDCNMQVPDGCEVNVNTDKNNCKNCGTMCSFANAAASCNGGTCEIGACNADFANCDGNPANGCEAPLKTDEANCGTCGNECAALNGTSMCVTGNCQFSCNAPFQDCDGLDANGCETNTSNTVSHCGTCNNACTSMSGTPFCVGGQCGETICPPNTANCNGTLGDGPLMNGCETDTTTPQNCGSCGHVCSSSNGTPSCNSGTCLIACNQGFGNCNADVNDGCEQQLNTNQHCTGCNVACQKPNAITSCGTGSCQIVSCQSGFADCNNNPADGCEAQLATDEGNCGACDNQCNPANGVGLCVAGGCTIQTCNAPFANCNGGYADGCEVNLNNDPLHCGSCPNQCGFPNASATCNNGMCQISGCDNPFNNCDGLSANGCEANLQTSAQNCGSCGNVCASINGAASCVNFACTINCNSGFKNCNGLFDDGCETNVHTLDDCGNCGVQCALDHASESCSTGTCQIVMCEVGWNNCDGVTFNGCECNATCAGGICQGCGDGFCTGNETCMSCPGDCGMCQPVCPDGSCNGAETCLSCPMDCGGCAPFCPDGTCNGGEMCQSCPADCGMCPPSCPDGSCNGGETCQSCPMDCGNCPPLCGNFFCNAGETCANCPIDCGMCPPICPDGNCNGAETCMTCPIDCGGCAPFCGDTFCNNGETCATCPMDCGGPCNPCGDLICDMAMGETCLNCQIDCGLCPDGGGSGGSGGGDGGCGPYMGVPCNGDNCMASGCCYYPGGTVTCNPPAMCNGVNDLYYACNDKSDCGNGNVCCRPMGGGSMCVQAGTCIGKELCAIPNGNTQSCECPTMQKCCPPSAMGDLHYATCQSLLMVCK